jgi:hypothetical protein
MDLEPERETCRLAQTTSIVAADRACVGLQIILRDSCTRNGCYFGSRGRAGVWDVFVVFDRRRRKHILFDTDCFGQFEIKKSDEVKVEVERCINSIESCA